LAKRLEHPPIIEAVTIGGWSWRQLGKVGRFEGDEKNSCGCEDALLLLLLLFFFDLFTQTFQRASASRLFAFLRSFESLWWGKEMWLKPKEPI